MKRLLTLFLALWTCAAWAQPIIRNQVTTNSFATGGEGFLLGISNSLPAWITNVPSLFITNIFSTTVNATTVKINGKDASVTSVNGTNITPLNLTNTATVTWARSGSNVFATASASGGDTLWTNSTTTLSPAVTNTAYAFGTRTLSGTTFAGATVDIYGIGTDAVANSTLSNAVHIYGIGKDANSGASYINLDNAYAFGNSPLGSALVTNASSIYAIGSFPLSQATLQSVNDIYGIGNGALASANLTNSADIVALGLNAGQNLSGAYSDLILLGGIGTRLRFTGQTNEIADNGTSLTYNGVPIGAGDTTATNIVTLTQTGTNAAQLDFSLVARGGVFKLALTNNAYFGVPANVNNTDFKHCWLSVLQPSTGTCFVTFTNGVFAQPGGNVLVNDTNANAVVWYEMVSSVFTSGVVEVWMSQRSARP